MKIIKRIKLFPKQYLNYLYLNKYIKIYNIIMILGASYTSTVAGNTGWLFVLHIFLSGFYIVYKCFVLNFMFGFSFLFMSWFAFKIAKDLDNQCKAYFIANNLAEDVIKELDEKKDK